MYAYKTRLYEYQIFKIEKKYKCHRVPIEVHGQGGLDRVGASDSNSKTTHRTLQSDEQQESAGARMKKAIKKSTHNVHWLCPLPSVFRITGALAGVLEI